mmetsp:Transcript_10601/g.15890  ORF Transcript_10601/g.15890 Transcript_10601/m.15890 type:complete len:181 (-) Transcript_10601:39-581(-)
MTQLFKLALLVLFIETIDCYLSSGIKSISKSGKWNKKVELSAEKRKRKKRRKNDSNDSIDIIDKMAGIEVSRDIGFNPSLSELFDDDWSGMQQPIGIKKAEKKFKLPEQNVSKIPNINDLKSELSEFQKPKRAREKSAAEKFSEGNPIKVLKIVTWFAVLALVGWEIFLHSPFFTPPEKS